MLMQKYGAVTSNNGDFIPICLKIWVVLLKIFIVIHLFCHPENLSIVKTKAPSEPENVPHLLVLEEPTQTRVIRLIIAHEINCIIFWHVTPYKTIKMHTTGMLIFHGILE